MKLGCLGILLLVFIVGCVVPTGRTARKGQVYSSDSLAFLDEKNTTRSEVISTFGHPYFESTNALVLVYVSETYTQWKGVILEPEFDADLNLTYRPEQVNDGSSNERLQALFIAYNPNGFVQSHVLRKISEQALNDRRLEELCQRQAMPPVKSEP
jgi:outer membrane protein assembly factor BamE (lipoprotein component of BamABCDE complex)